MSKFLRDFFDPAYWPAFSLGLRAILLLAILGVLVSGFRRNTIKTPSGGLFSRALFLVLVVVPFGVLAAYQASWQLAGLQRPEFVTFMQRFDRRNFNPARLVKRGKILDRKQRILAVSQSAGHQAARFYPLGPAGAHVVGYSDAKFGLSGLEAAWHGQLLGGGLTASGDWKILRKQILEGTPDIEGHDVACTLDGELQKLAYQLFNGERGAVVVMDIQNGDLLVVCSSPSFDPNRVSAATFGADERAPVFNRALHGLYPPGSTFKLVVASGSLEAGIKPSYDCPASGYTTSSKYSPIRDHEYYEAQRNGRTWSGQGVLGMGPALTKSSNVYFAHLGVDLGWDRLRESMKGFGFDARMTLLETDAATISAVSSPLPSTSASDLYGLAQASIGQGKILATPFQMAWLTATIANGGQRVKPRLFALGEAEILGRALSAVHARELSAMMFNVVESGTARGLRGLPFSVAGKTGTAQNPGGAAHSWFCGFAPYDHPRFAIAVLVEHGGYGSARAVPISREILNAAHQAGYW